MKDQYDNKTVDCFNSKHAVKQGERMILVLKNIINKRGRTSVKEVQQWIGVTNRNTANFINQLIIEGYLESNSKTPLSLKATDKAKQLFGVNA
ncbi:MAG: hypothetical protein RR677_11255 [Acinetobacter sp.]